MKIIKRNGSEAEFDLSKIVAAVTKANAACEKEELTPSQIRDIAEFVEFKITKAHVPFPLKKFRTLLKTRSWLRAHLRLPKGMLNTVTTVRL